LGRIHESVRGPTWGGVGPTYVSHYQPTRGTTRSDKTLAPATWVATAGYAVTGALELLHDQRSTFATPLDYLIEIAFAVGLGATAVATYALYATRPRARSVAVGWLLATVGHLALFVSAAGTAAAGHDALGPAFTLGLLAALGGYVTLLVADLRGRVRPARAGVVLLVGLVGSVVLGAVTAAMLSNGGGGTLALAASWAAVARLAAAGGPVGHPADDGRAEPLRTA
jgi:hypothetical protein